jgi:hypothetical protein
MRADSVSKAHRALRLAAFAILFSSAAGCDETAPGRTYYERQVQPILHQFCSGNTGGCHAIDDGDPFAFAAGNFDVTSFETVQKRRDLLKPSGPYSMPPLLIKAAGRTDELQIAYRGQFHPLEISHAGGNILQVGSDAYMTLLEWTENGATANGLPPAAPPRPGLGACSPLVPADFDAASYTASPYFGDFVSKVQPVLESCAASSCHGAPQSDFHITCGEDDTQRAFNFSQVQAFIDAPVENSPILLVPLAVSAGGYFHTGGEHFPSRSHGGYTAIRDWAQNVGGVDFGEGDPGRAFFARYVQPKLLTLGCSLEGCHSPGATNDFKLRSGSQGFFSAIALERNYELLRDDFMALEVPDARRGRAVAKGILPVFGGIAHRGGPALETPGSGGANPASCPEPFDPEAASAFCIMQEWVNIERAAMVASGQVLPLAANDIVAMVYVQRDAGHMASPLEFDTYQPGSDLMVADIALDEAGSLSYVTASRSLLDNCPEAADRGVVDVRGPDVRHDGVTLAFAMRTAATEPLSIYTVDIAGESCIRLTPPQADVNGIKIHNFDPAWSPDGQSIVFASTRGGATGPSLSRKHFLPQSDIWRMDMDGSSPERVTFLTNSEISPQMLREGRIIMTTEKISGGFYQLSGRRINWDLTDYHPLLAQRAESRFAGPGTWDAVAPSVGYAQATEIREGLDGNFLLILSDEGARGGAGTLAIFNRSVGTFELGREDPGFVKSVVFPDTAATGRVGATTSGAYRSPFPLPDGRILVSYAAYGGDLGTATSLDWDLVALHPRTGERTPLVVEPGAQVEAVLALKHPPRDLYYNRRQLVFGGGEDVAITGGQEWGVIHVPDAPLIFTLLSANLRRGRPVELFQGARRLAAYREQPAPPGTGSGSGEGGIYQMREFLGSALLAPDGSARVRVPAGTGIILELQDEGGGIIETMREEHQVGPGEVVSMGIKRELFDAVCGGCHGSISGKETDIAVTPDALTGASESLSANDAPALLSR